MKEKMPVAISDDPGDIRQFLGEAAQGYTDAQLSQVRREVFAMAELLLDIYLEKQRSRKRSRRDGLTESAREVGFI